jgi:hypothetical protein
MDLSICFKTARFYQPLFAHKRVRNTSHIKSMTEKYSSFKLHQEVLLRAALVSDLRDVNY